MSGELGLQRNFHQNVWGPLQAYRGNDATPGHEIDLIEFMQNHLNMTSADGSRPIEMEDIFIDLGRAPSELTLDNLISLDDMKYLAPEIIRATILEGLEMRQTYKSLIAGSENVDNMHVVAPWVKYKDTAPVDTGEAETIAEAEIEWGEKSVKVKKMARAITYSDELILSIKIPLLKYFLRRFGVDLAAGLYTEAVQTLVNGDQADGSDAVAVLGTANGTSTVFSDFVTAWVRGDMIGMKWENLINNEAMANTILGLDEFKSPQGAGSVVTKLDSVDRIIPSRMPHMTSSVLADTQNLLFDPQQCMIQLLFRGLLVESERIIMRQINGTAASIITGWLTLERMARIMIDHQYTKVAKDFPTWMAPLV